MQLSALHYLVQTLTIPSGACCAQYSAVFVPATPNGVFLPQLSVLHFLLQTLSIPSGACYAQCSVVLVPVTPNVDNLPQPWVLHYMLFTSVGLGLNGVIVRWSLIGRAL